VDVKEERIAGDLSEGEGRDAVELVAGLGQTDVRERDVDDEIPLRPVEAPGLAVFRGILDDLAVLRRPRHAAVAGDAFWICGRPGRREERRIAAGDGASSGVEDPVDVIAPVPDRERRPEGEHDDRRAPGQLLWSVRVG